MSNTMTHPANPQVPFNRVAVLFSGGPAPGANAVISSCASSFQKSGVEVVGIKHGYSYLMEYSPSKPLVENQDYIFLNSKRLKRTRNTRGIIIGTARANPGAKVNSPDDLKDEEKTAPLRTVYEALRSIGVEALVSIGGDDTLKTANKLAEFQKTLPEDMPRIKVVHVPKTIDNDYMGIDFTFGYFTAVDVLAEEIRNMLADAEADRNYFVVETMGRSAGWLAYGAAIASEASFAISVEDIVGDYRTEEEVTLEDGSTLTRPIMDIDKVVDRIVQTMRHREEREGKNFGIIVVAEGLAEFLPWSKLEHVPRDAHGHISASEVDLARFLSKLVQKAFNEQTGRERKCKPFQLGYESRCARPHSFDVMLGSQLGVGAYRALMEEGHSGVMVSVSGQLDLQYVPFSALIDPDTMVTVVRFVRTDSDFHKLVRFLESHVNR